MVRIPIPLDPNLIEQQTARMAVEADTKVTQRLAKEYKMFEEGPIQVGDVKGYKTITRFNIKNHEQKRIRAYFFKKPFLYFFVCDARPPGNYEKVKDGFNEVINSFKILEPKEGQSLEQEIVSEYAKGSISGNVYTSREYNCFIAAPEGWEIRTSPNPVHLVEMRYEKGKSLVRLVAMKDIPDSVGYKKIYEERREALEKLVKNFKEVQKNDITIQGVPGIDSYQTYSIEVIGSLQVREVTLFKDGILYLIMCQAIEPDTYEQLKEDFEKIVNSFGFIQ
jgi:hypothetical protein